MMKRRMKAYVCLLTVFCMLILSACVGAGENTPTEPIGTTAPQQVSVAPETSQPPATTEPVNKELWDVMHYRDLEDILDIQELDLEVKEVTTYKIRYKSDDCEVTAYLSIPNRCLEEQLVYSCIISNRGGNRDLSINNPEWNAMYAWELDSIIFASDYRGCSTGTGQDEFGGDDVHDVLKLIDFAEQFAFVDMERLYMLGGSRGGMMTYIAMREDARIQKGIVVSGVADLFMTYEQRADMRIRVLNPLIGGSPEELPEEYEKRSATYWADEIQCPVLIIHSKLDLSVYYEQAEKMVAALEAAGKEYQYILHPDDVHGLHAEDFETIKAWCDLGVKG